MKKSYEEIAKEILELRFNIKLSEDSIKLYSSNLSLCKNPTEILNFKGKIKEAKDFLSKVKKQI